MKPGGVWIAPDPSARWARSWGEFVRQLRDIFLYEFWMAQGRPERAPGARVVYKTDIGAGGPARRPFIFTTSVSRVDMGIDFSCPRGTLRGAL